MTKKTRPTSQKSNHYSPATFIEISDKQNAALLLLQWSPGI